MANRKAPVAAIIIIVIVAALLRTFYAIDKPLDGDEVGVGVLQASGQAAGYIKKLPAENVPLARIKGFISYSRDYSPRDVLLSLRHEGMHPPFYYLSLHYILRFVENNTFTLRLISVLMSILSVVFLFLLGREIHSKEAGLFMALLLALSHYAVEVGPMVRPYPLAMLLSLISTLQMYKLCKEGGSGFEKKKLVLYSITVLIGLYTIYHFLFVFIFQAAFLTLQNLRSRKSMIELCVMVGAVFVLYLPWVPSLLDQLSVVRGGSFYFHESGSGLIHIEAVPIVSIIILGCYFVLRKDKRLCSFSIALMVSLLSNYALDTVMNTHTLTIGKLQFFTTPIALLLVAVGTFHIPKKYYFRSIAITLCCLFLLGFLGSLYSREHKLVTAEAYLESFPKIINSRVDNGEKALVILNSKTRRLLFPMAQELRGPVDIKILKTGNVDAEMVRIKGLKDYDSVFVTNLYAEYDKGSYLSPEGLRTISEYLSRNDFIYTRSFESGEEPNRHLLVVFEKQA